MAISSTYPHGPVAVIRVGQTCQARVYGPVNRDAVPVIGQRLEESLASGCTAVALDLGAAEFIDSDGVRWLQQFHEQHASRGVQLSVAVRAGSRVERTLDILKVDREIPLNRYPHEKAVAAPSRR